MAQRFNALIRHHSEHSPVILRPKAEGSLRFFVALRAPQDDAVCLFLVLMFLTFLISGYTQNTESTTDLDAIAQRMAFLSSGLGTMLEPPKMDEQIQIPDQGSPNRKGELSHEKSIS